MKIQDFKMRVTPEQSKIVQETLFANGYRWKSNCNSVVYINSPNLYLSDGSIQKGNDYREFINEPEPELTFEQFKEKYIDNEFVLPDRWHVVVTKDNLELLSQWRFGEGYPDNKLSVGKITGVSTEEMAPGHNPANILSGDTYDFGKELTTEQFKKYVLNMKEDKELIGYRPLLKYYHLCNTILNDNRFDYKFSKLNLRDQIIKKHSRIHNLFIEYKVLDIWFEPVYKEKYSLPVIEGYEGEFLEDSNQIKYGCKTVSVKTLNELLSLGVSTVTIEDLDTHRVSQYKITRRDIKEILKYINTTK